MTPTSCRMAVDGIGCPPAMLNSWRSILSSIPMDQWQARRRQRSSFSRRPCIRQARRVSRSKSEPAVRQGCIRRSCSYGRNSPTARPDSVKCRCAAAWRARETPSSRSSMTVAFPLPPLPVCPAPIGSRSSWLMNPGPPTGKGDRGRGTVAEADRHPGGARGRGPVGVVLTRWGPARLRVAGSNGSPVGGSEETGCHPLRTREVGLLRVVLSGRGPFSPPGHRTGRSDCGTWRADRAQLPSWVTPAGSGPCRSLGTGPFSPPGHRRDGQTVGCGERTERRHPGRTCGRGPIGVVLTRWGPACLRVAGQDGSPVGRSEETGRRHPLGTWGVGLLRVVLSGRVHPRLRVVGPDGQTVECGQPTEHRYPRGSQQPGPVRVVLSGRVPSRLRVAGRDGQTVGCGERTGDRQPLRTRGPRRVRVVLPGQGPPGFRVGGRRHDCALGRVGVDGGSSRGAGDGLGRRPAGAGGCDPGRALHRAGAGSGRGPPGGGHRHLFRHRRRRGSVRGDREHRCRRPRRRHPDPGPRTRDDHRRGGRGRPGHGELLCRRAERFPGP